LRAAFFFALPALAVFGFLGFTLNPKLNDKSFFENFIYTSFLRGSFRTCGCRNFKIAEEGREVERIVNLGVSPLAWGTFGAP
jgi:hypothetical protein